MLEITVSEVLEKEANGEKLNFIDVREVDEVAQGIISNAVHIPLAEVESRLNELNKDHEYIIVCRSGGRSGVATQTLALAGYKVKNMLGGMLDWTGEVVVK